MFRQEAAEITKSGDGNLGIAESERRARGGVEHPRRDDNAGALLALDKDNVSPAAPLRIKYPDRAAMERVPPIVDRRFLTDTSRITPQWP